MWVDTHSAKIAIIAIKRVCVDDSDAGADFGAGAGAGAGASVNEDSNKDGLDSNETTTESARIDGGEGKLTPVGMYDMVLWVLQRQDSWGML